MSFARTARGARTAARRRSAGVGGGGSLPVTETWTGANGSGWPPGWSFAGVGSSEIQSNTGRMTCSGFYGARRARWNTGVADFADAEALITFTLPAGECYFAIALRTLDTNASVDGNAGMPSRGIMCDLSSSSIALKRFTASARTNLTSAAVTLTPGTAYKLRFRPVGGLYKARVWAASGSEPGTWNLDYTDGSPYLTPGQPWMSWVTGADAVSRTVTVDDYVISAAV